MKAVAKIFRQGNRFGVAVNLNRLAARIYHQPALPASLQVLIELRQAGGVQLSI
jgi:hypothetical protein